VAFGLGRGQRLVWALASLGALLGMHALDASGYRFPQYLATENLVFDKVMTWLTSMLVTIAILYIYESARGRSLKILEEAKEWAETANLAKGRFLAKMSHEFRTPLNAITGFSEVLQVEQLDADRMQDLRAIKSSAYALLSLIEDVLDLAAIEVGRLCFHPEPFRPEAIVAELVDGLHKRAAGKGLELMSELHELPTRMMGDPRRFRQILLNLLDNALKFTDAGTILALTANALDEERLRCMDAGMDGFITKPIEPAELMRTLESWLVQDDRRDGNLSESSV